MTTKAVTNGHPSTAPAAAKKSDANEIAQERLTQMITDEKKNWEVIAQSLKEDAFFLAVTIPQLDEVLSNAAADGRVECIRLILEKTNGKKPGRLIEERTHIIGNALLIATQKRQEACLVLLQKNLPAGMVNAKTAPEQNPTDVMFQKLMSDLYRDKNWKDIEQVLGQQNAFILTISTSQIDQILATAAAEGRVKCVRLILEKTCSRTEFPDYQKDDERRFIPERAEIIGNALVAAARNGQVECLAMLLQHNPPAGVVSYALKQTEKLALKQNPATAILNCKDALKTWLMAAAAKCV